MSNNSDLIHLSAETDRLIVINIDQTIAKLKNNQDLFWDIWQTQEKKVFNYCFYRLTKNLHDAQDLCSETMIKAHDKLPSANNDAKILGWLLKLARHIYFDQKRKKQTQLKYHTIIAENDTSQVVELFDHTFNAIILQFVTKVINKTSEKYRVVAFEYFFYEKSYKQISIDHDQSESHVRKLIFRARRQISPAIFKFIHK